MSARAATLSVMVALLWGCGGSGSGPGPEPQAPGTGPSPMAPDDDRTRSSGGEPEASAEPEPTGDPGAHDELSPEIDGRIARSELDPILEAGLGKFLQGVETEPHTEDGDFVGFRLKSPPWPEDDRFADVELREGDIVTRINGQPIEKPDQAMQVWQSLRVASELMIEYVRDGDERELRYAIVE